MIGRLTGAFGIGMSALLANAEPSPKGWCGPTNDKVWVDPKSG
jgi:hypothetical protein